MKFSAILRAATTIIMAVSASLQSHAGEIGIPPSVNPAAMVVPSASVAAAATLRIVITVRLNTAISLAQEVSCSATINSSDASCYNYASADELLVKSSSTAGACTITIPYVWRIAASTTQMGVSVSISTNNGFGPSSLTRNASATITPFPVPTSSVRTERVTLAL